MKKEYLKSHFHKFDFIQRLETKKKQFQILPFLITFHERATYPPDRGGARDRKSDCDSKRLRDTVSHYLRLKEEESVVGTRISRRTWRHPLIKYKCSPAVPYYRDVDVAKSVFEL